MARVGGILLAILIFATGSSATEPAELPRNVRSPDGGFAFSPDPHFPLRSGEAALARRLSGMWTRDSAALVRLVSDARELEGSGLATELILAVAHAETNGRPWLVSEAGAVGLAQATPAAWIDEGFGGKLFITETYLEGTRAYLQKKPLYDAWVVSRRMLECGPDEEARRLLDQTWTLIGEGDAQIETLARFGSPELFRATEEASVRNEEIVGRLENLFETPDAEEIDRVGQEALLWYQLMKETQRENWVAYHDEITGRRDRLIREGLGLDPDQAKKNHAYLIAEFLGCELDARFLPAESARFLVRHLDSRFDDAEALGFSGADRERWALALYNGGSHNVKRLVAGLMRTLPETDRYVVKIPATRDSLSEAARGVR